MLYMIPGSAGPKPAGYEREQQRKENRDPGVPDSALWNTPLSQTHAYGTLARPACRHLMPAHPVIRLTTSV